MAVLQGALGAGAACGPTYETRTVMRSQYVTESRQVPVTTYQRETRTRMKNVTKRVARVETRQQTYTVNVPQTQTRTETYNVQVCVPYTEEQFSTRFKFLSRLRLKSLPG